MTETTELKTLEDGSIDYAHYMQRGRELRSGAFYAALKALGTAVAARRRMRAAGNALRDLAPSGAGSANTALQPGE